MVAYVFPHSHSHRRGVSGSQRIIDPSMKPFLHVRLSLAVAVVAALAVAGPVQAQRGHATLRIPATQTFFNPCTQENVTLRGMLLGNLHVRQTRDGQLLVYARINAAGVSGTGESSGASYRGSGQASFRGTFTGFPVEVMTRFRLSRQGQGGDARGTAVISISRADDGTFSASLVSVSADCRDIPGIDGFVPVMEAEM